MVAHFQHSPPPSQNQVVRGMWTFGRRERWYLGEIPKVHHWLGPKLGWMVGGKLSGYSPVNEDGNEKKTPFLIGDTSFFSIGHVSVQGCNPIHFEFLGQRMVLAYRLTIHTTEDQNETELC